mmetsp:Transcript_112802/g.240764  ORF Transcript_112802/g.240764 Transcript_112802/m.240764 type:complete len:392 (+) Transcript_112802:87-1262(+)
MIDYEENWLVPLLFRRKGSVAIRAACYAAPSAMLGVLLVSLDDSGFEALRWLRDDLEMRQLAASHLWGATAATVLFLLSFRTSQSLSRFWEGTTLLHQMRGEWFDTVSNCVTFSISAKRIRPHEVMVFRHCLVRLMSLAHGAALEEISDYQIMVPCIDVLGLDIATLSHVKDCHENYRFNKVEIMLHLIQSLITQAHVNGILDVPAPILSRVYQTISRGFVNLLNAKKITDTQFPFPYAQLISCMLFLLMLVTPLLLSAVVTSKPLMATLTFIYLFALFSLNFIASELDNPFGVDDNDLPLGHFQTEMNSCLMMLLHKNTDMISGLNPNTNMDFETLNSPLTIGSRRLSMVQANVTGSPFVSEQPEKQSPVMSESRRSSSSSVHSTVNADI